MAQQQGSVSSSSGRLGGELQKTTLTAASFALGVGWGDGAVTKVLTAGSTDQRGQIVITSVGSNQAQATATVTLTFADGAFASAPFGFVTLADSTQAVNDPQPTDQATTTTTLSWTAGAIPVATKIYTFNYVVIA